MLNIPLLDIEETIEDESILVHNVDELMFTDVVELTSHTPCHSWSYWPDPVILPESTQHNEIQEEESFKHMVYGFVISTLSLF